MSATAALSPAITAALNFFQNAEKSDSANAFGNAKSIKRHVNQACALILRTGPTDLISDIFIVVLVIMSFVRYAFFLDLSDHASVPRPVRPVINDSSFVFELLFRRLMRLDDIPIAGTEC